MSSLKTFVFCGLGTGLLASPALTNPLDLTMFMAGCAGLYSAEVEHAWLMQDPQSSALEDQRAEFVAILEALTPADAEAGVLAHRIETKKAHAQLLSLATFGADAHHAAWAKRQSQYLNANCAERLLKS